MAKYICLDHELDISKYKQLKSVQEGFEIVYDNEWSQLSNEYPLDIGTTKTYQCFRNISLSIQRTHLFRDKDEMRFAYVYDVGQMNDVYLALVLSETNINLIIDISLEDLDNCLIMLIHHMRNMRLLIILKKALELCLIR